MSFVTIDINCDVGEGINNERQLFPYISSCNIACGGHAGDVYSMQKVVLLAKENQLRIGGHPSYPDTKNFGRISMDISDNELIESVREQLANLQKVLKKEGIPMHHIKAHGALYNDIAKNTKLAGTFLKAIVPFRQSAVVYLPYGTVIAALALKEGFQIKYEAFADRNYNTNLSLVSRSRGEALITSPKKVLKHLVNMVKNKEVITYKGHKVPMIAHTYCIHGDSPSALQILMYLDKELPNHNIHIKK